MMETIQAVMSVIIVILAALYIFKSKKFKSNTDKCVGCDGCKLKEECEKRSTENKGKN